MEFEYGSTGNLGFVNGVGISPDFLECAYQCEIGCDAPGTVIFDVPIRFIFPEYIPIPDAPIPVGDAFD